jgi:hypothetical protein
VITCINEMVSAPNLLSKLIYAIAGLVVGLGFCVIFVFITADKNSEKNTSKEILKLEINRPANYIATSEKTITFSGKTTVESIITVNSSQKSTVIAAKTGEFSFSLDLIEGKNLINISSYDPKTGLSETATREILYLNEDLSSL